MTVEVSSVEELLAVTQTPGIKWVLVADLDLAGTEIPPEIFWPVGLLPLNAGGE